MKNQKEIMEKIYKVCGYIKGIVDEIIPEKWDSFYFNGEIATNAGIGSIYFFYNTIKNKDEYVYSLDILEKYDNISEDELENKEEELFDLVFELKEIFITNKLGNWNNFILIVNSKREADIKFDYTDWNSSKYTDADRINYFLYRYVGIPSENKEQEELFLEMKAYQKRFEI